METGAKHELCCTGPAPYYAADGITIFNGDCLEVLPALPAESVDFVCTDPPYGVAFRGRFDRKHEPIAGDEELTWLEPVFREVWRLMKPDSLCVSFYGWPHSGIWMNAWKAVGFRPVSHFCLVLSSLGLGRYSRSRHLTAFLLAKGHPAPPEKAIADALDCQREDNPLHPNQKPLAAITQLLLTYAPDDGLVLDPFLGSGTTARAAKNIGLSAIGVEIDQDYCRKAAERMAQGVLPFCSLKKPYRVEGGLFPE